jgi:hypothetical protein
MRLDGGLKAKGNAAEARGGGAAPGTGGAAREKGLEVGDAPDRWVPPVGERERERRGGGVLGRVGRKLMGRRDWVGLDRFFFFFFSFLFQTHF